MPARHHTEQEKIQQTMNRVGLNYEQSQRLRSLKSNDYYHYRKVLHHIHRVRSGEMTIDEILTTNFKMLGNHRGKRKPLIAKGTIKRRKVRKSYPFEKFQHSGPTIELNAVQQYHQFQERTGSVTGYGRFPQLFWQDGSLRSK